MSDAKEIILELRTDLEEVAWNGAEIWARQERARQVRFNEWEGQSPDGRKHAEALGTEALPFEGAPDNRIPFADGAIIEKVALCGRVFFRGLAQAKAQNPANAPRAASVSALLGWLRDTAMREELEIEVPLSAQYLFGDDPGLAIIEVTWRRDLALERRALSFDELAAMWVTGAASPDDVRANDPRLEAEMLAEFMDLATNPERAGEFVLWLGAMFPGATGRALRAAAREVRTAGAAELPVPAVRENRPGVCALKYFDDVFFPAGTADLQRARGIDRREWLSEVELRERVHTLGWGREVVAEILEAGKGQSLLAEPLAWRTAAGQQSGLGRMANEHDHLFEVWWSYRREADEMGIPGITCTVWSSVVKDAWLKRTVADYPDGEYPFVMKSREQLSRRAADSRGLTVPIATHQTEIKVQRDGRGAHVQMLASPPIKTRQLRGAYELVLAPNAQIPVQRMDDFEVVTLPNFMQNSVEMEAVTVKEASEYCGLMRPDADPNRVGLIQQAESDNFIGLWCAAFAKALALAQVFYSEEELDRVTGQDGLPLHLTAAEVRGKWGVSIEIDARDLNLEFALKKLEAYGKVLSYDTGGTLDRAPVAEWAAFAIDPILARRSVQPAGVVTKKIIDEERQNVTNMALGIEPVMNPDGTTNPQFRQQVLGQTITQSPKLMELYRGDELFRELVANYQKYLAQQNTQEENKLVGRLGTAPTQGVPGLYPAAGALPAA